MRRHLSFLVAIAAMFREKCMTTLKRAMCAEGAICTGNHVTCKQLSRAFYFRLFGSGFNERVYYAVAVGRNCC